MEAVQSSSVYPLRPARPDLIWSLLYECLYPIHDIPVFLDRTSFQFSSLVYQLVLDNECSPVCLPQIDEGSLSVIQHVKSVAIHFIIRHFFVVDQRRRSHKKVLADAQIIVQVNGIILLFDEILVTVTGRVWHVKTGWLWKPVHHEAVALWGLAAWWHKQKLTKQTFWTAGVFDEIVGDILEARGIAFVMGYLDEEEAGAKEAKHLSLEQS